MQDPSPSTVEQTEVSVIPEDQKNLFKNISFLAGTGLQKYSMKITDVETNAPSPSTASGYQIDYPVGLELKLSFQFEKVYTNFSVAAEICHSETSLTTGPIIKFTSVGLVLKYLSL